MFKVITDHTSVGHDMDTNPQITKITKRFLAIFKVAMQSKEQSNMSLSLGVTWFPTPRKCLTETPTLRDTPSKQVQPGQDAV